MSKNASSPACHDSSASNWAKSGIPMSTQGDDPTLQDGLRLSRNDAASSFARRLELFLENVVQKFGQRLNEFLSENVQCQAPRYADAKNNPLGTARAFLDAGRRGDFPTFKRSRAIVARWSDVEQYIERCGRQPPKATALDDDLELLRKAGVRLRSSDGGSAEIRQLDVGTRRRS